MHVKLHIANKEDAGADASIVVRWSVL